MKNKKTTLVSRFFQSALFMVAVLSAAQFAEAAGGYQTACKAHCADGANCGIVATDFSFPWTSSCNKSNLEEL